MKKARTRTYKKVDTSKMNSSQLAKYKKTLAYVRAYTRDRRDWQKAAKAGHTKFRTLAEFRSAKHGAFSAARSAKAVETARDQLKKKIPDPICHDMIQKLERLLISLKQADQIQRQVFEEMHSLVG